jgi:hypothetical protein
MPLEPKTPEIEDTNHNGGGSGGGDYSEIDPIILGLLARLPNQEMSNRALSLMTMSPDESVGARIRST